MFNIGGSELLVILFVALIFLGPERLPTAARQVGKTMTQLRQMAAGFQREFEDAVNLGEESARGNLTEEQARANGAALVAAEAEAKADAAAAAENEDDDIAADQPAAFDPTAEPDRTEKPKSDGGPMFHSAAPGVGPQRKPPAVSTDIAEDTAEAVAVDDAAAINGASDQLEGLSDGGISDGVISESLSDGVISDGVISDQRDDG